MNFLLSENLPYVLSLNHSIIFYLAFQKIETETSDLNITIEANSTLETNTNVENITEKLDGT